MATALWLSKGMAIDLRSKIMRINEWMLQNCHYNIIGLRAWPLHFSSHYTLVVKREWIGTALIFAIATSERGHCTLVQKGMDWDSVAKTPIF